HNISPLQLMSYPFCKAFKSNVTSNLPYVNPENCSFPFTYNGSLYYSCVRNVTGVTQCDQRACLLANRTWAICYEPAGLIKLRFNSLYYDISYSCSVVNISLIGNLLAAI